MSNIQLFRRSAREGYTKVGYMKPVADGRLWDTVPTIYLETTPGGDQVFQTYMTLDQAKRVAREINAAVRACS